MKKLRKFMSILSLASIGAGMNVHADEPYVGFFITPIDIEPVNLVGLGAKFGYPFNEHVAVEIRGITGIDKDSFLGVDVELESIYAGHLRMGGSISETFHPYLMIGYARTKVSAAIGSFQASAAESRLSYGAGFVSDITEHTGLNVEIMNYFQGSGNDEIYGVTFGFVTELFRPE